MTFLHDMHVQLCMQIIFSSPLCLLPSCSSFFSFFLSPFSLLFLPFLSLSFSPSLFSLPISPHLSHPSLLSPLLSIQLLYQGSGICVGITGKDVPRGKWTEVEVPDPKAKISHLACDSTGSFCLVISDKGVVYFGGVNKKGEAGENGKCTPIQK